jgi:hypothetical protein
MTNCFGYAIISTEGGKIPLLWRGGENSKNF